MFGTTAVEKAKENLQKKYFAVGILEDLGSFLEFLERGLPDYFAGAREILGTKIGFGFLDRALI